MSKKKKSKGEKELSEVPGEAKQMLETLAKCDKPCGNKDIAETTGIDKKVISKEITALKKKGLVDSPVRCGYSITDAGRSSLGGDIFLREGKALLVCLPIQWKC